MNPQEILLKIGLNEREISIYLALIELGPSNISEISKKTGLHRPAIYETLPTLENKNLIALAPKGKRRRYAATPPTKLHNLAETVLHNLDSLIPELQKKMESSKKKPLVTYSEGQEGIANAFEDVVTTLGKGDVYYRYSSRKNVRESGKYLPKNYRETRDKKQLGRFVITNEKNQQEKKPSLDRSLKVVPKEFGLFEDDITQIIYDDKIAVIDYNTETVITIQNPIIAGFQRKIFKALFEKL